MSELNQLFEKLDLIPTGYSEGYYRQGRYGTTLKVSEDGKRIQLFARELGGSDFISFNLFRLRSGETQLRPCEMAKQKVVAFVTGYLPESASAPNLTAKPYSPSSGNG